MRIIFIVAVGGSMEQLMKDFIYVLIESYFLWVVWAFMTEIKDEVAMSPQYHSKPVIYNV